MARVVITSLALFVMAALAEIGGGYLIWQWLRESKGKLLGIVGGLMLFSYGIIPTLQPAGFGRVYAAYGGIFIAMSIVWGMIVDKKKPDRYEVVGGLIAIIGAAVLMYSPR